MTVENVYGHVDIFAEEDEITNEEYAILDYVYVKKYYRQQGHARELVTLAIEHAKDMSDTIRIVAHEFDARVIDLASLVEFYESCGFTVEEAEGANVVLVMHTGEGE